ncbi:hypothetical protein H6P81_015689 [Aristolochia fimbriata]|uniref:AIPP2-like SPOC-like domain-containing protein n=1 Tax=Aristolochia fimbriata TaxID=158543 RepID=A0AAV7E6G1_ARIFI|nr:hypothetical protein H6P81_015689 [Aristolochia fimbriata]
MVLRAKVCSKCGDGGFPELLIYCRKCKYFAEHRYCLTQMPPLHQSEVLWVCEDCLGSDSTYAAPSKGIGSGACPNSLSSRPISSEVQNIASGRGSDGGRETRNPRRKLVLLDESSSDEDGENCRGQSGAGTTTCNSYILSKPYEDHVWRGCFDIEPQWSVGVTGHLSNTACLRVWEGANRLPARISLESLPRTKAWPKNFLNSPPTGENIGLFFFPETQGDEMAFDDLIKEVVDRELVLKATSEGDELHIFSSLVLPQAYWHFHGNCYLWGLFKTRQLPIRDTTNCLEKCLELFPLEVEDIAIAARLEGNVNEIDTELGLGRSCKELNKIKHQAGQGQRGVSLGKRTEQELSDMEVVKTRHTFTILIDEQA